MTRKNPFKGTKMPTKTKLSKFLAGKERIKQIEALSDLNSNSMEPFRNNEVYGLLRDLEEALCELFSQEITAYYVSRKTL